VEEKPGPLFWHWRFSLAASVERPLSLCGKMRRASNMRRTRLCSVQIRGDCFTAAKLGVTVQQAVVYFVLVISALLLCSGIAGVVYLIAT
jgi:hypothetical protein